MHYCMPRNYRIKDLMLIVILRGQLWWIRSMEGRSRILSGLSMFESCFRYVRVSMSNWLCPELELKTKNWKPCAVAWVCHMQTIKWNEYSAHSYNPSIDRPRQEDAWLQRQPAYRVSCCFFLKKKKGKIFILDLMINSPWVEDLETLKICKGEKPKLLSVSPRRLG